MLRGLIGVLLAANLLVLAWTAGAFDGVISTPSLRSGGDREPERLQRQVRPETIRILPADAANVAAAPAVAPVCLEAGPFPNEQALAAAQAAVGTVVPAADLEVVRQEQPPSWLVFMGRFATPAAQLRREDELNRRGVVYEETVEPDPLAPGLVLGRFASREAADQALVQLVGKGVRPLRVVVPTGPVVATLVRVARADAAMAGRLSALGGETALAGKAFRACGSPP